MSSQPSMGKMGGGSDKPVRVSLIIAVYKRVDFLGLVLTSVENQSFRNMEVIIAEDDQSDDIRNFILSKTEAFPFRIKHVNQEDRGFRKNRVLNKAILASEGEHLIFIDGDCILHKKFIEAHVKRLKPGLCLFGRRAMLSRRLTTKLIHSGNIKGLSVFTMLLTKTRCLESGIYVPWIPSFRKFGVKGCNFSLSRDLMYKINGFDEDFESIFGGEDTDVERRLRLIDTEFLCIKFKAVQYHLYHEGREGREESWETEGKAFYQKKIDEELPFCKNGLLRHRETG